MPLNPTGKPVRCMQVLYRRSEAQANSKSSTRARVVAGENTGSAVCSVSIYMTCATGANGPMHAQNGSDLEVEVGK